MQKLQGPTTKIKTPRSKPPKSKAIYVFTPGNRSNAFCNPTPELQVAGHSSALGRTMAIRLESAWLQSQPNAVVPRNGYRHVGKKWYILGPHHQMSLPYKTVSQIMIGVDLLQNGYHLGTHPWPPSNNWVNNYLLQNGTAIFIALMIDVKNDPGTKSFHARSFFLSKW